MKDEPLLDAIVSVGEIKMLMGYTDLYNDTSVLGDRKNMCIRQLSIHLTLLYLLCKIGLCRSADMMLHIVCFWKTSVMISSVDGLL